MIKVFINYAHEDLASARKLFEQLRANKDIEPWFDKESLMPGMRWRPEIRKAIREADFFIALMSRSSTGRRGFVNTELKNGLEVLQEFPEGQIYFIPVRLDDCDVPFSIKEIQYVDFFPDWNSGFRRVIASINTRVSIKTQEPPEKKLATPRYHFRIGLVDIDDQIPNSGPFVERLNNAQDYFFFSIQQMPSLDVVHTIRGLPNFDVHRVPSSYYSERINLGVDMVACLTRFPLAFQVDHLVLSNYFSVPGERDERFIFISTFELSDYAHQAKRSFEKAIICSVASQLVMYFTDLGCHRDTRGCIMDFCERRADIVEGLKTLKFCSSCEPNVRNRDFYDAVQALLQDENI